MMANIPTQNFKIAAFVLLSLLIYTDYTIHAFGNSYSREISLDMTDNLRLFENCTVHIVQPILEDSIFVYNVQRPDFPIVYSEYLFVKSWPQGLVCKNQRYQLGNNKGIGRNVTPIYSKTCEAILYMIPPDCSSQINVQFVYMNSLAVRDILMPASAKRLMVPPLVIHKLKSENIKMPTTYRSGIYFVAISALSTLQDEWLSSLFGVVDLEYSLESVFLPAKMFIQVGFSLEENIFDGRYLTAHSKSLFIVGNVLDARIGNTDVRNRRHFVHQIANSRVPSFKVMSYKLFLGSWSSLPELDIALMNTYLNSGQQIWEIQSPNYFTVYMKFKNPYFIGISRNIPKNLVFLNLIQTNATACFDYRSEVRGFPVYIIADDQTRMQFTNFQNKGYHFVTCADVYEMGNMSFYGFISAFGYKTWILILISWCSLAIFIQMRERRITFSSIIFPLMTLIEQEANICKRYKILTAGWLLMCIILSESYKGENVTDLIAPIEGEKLEHFEQLVKYNFSILSKAEMTLETSEDRTVNLAFSLLKVFLGKDATIRRKKLPTTFDRAYGVSRPDGLNPNMINRVEALLYRPIHLYDVFNIMKISYLFNSTANCTRVAYIDEYEIVHKMYLRLKAKFSNDRNHSKLSRLTISKESLGETVVTWLFKNIRYPANKFIIRVHSLSESGLVDAWNKWSFRMSSWNDTVELARLEAGRTFNGMSIHGNIKVVFIVYLVNILISTVQFFGEIRKCIWKRLYQIVFYVPQSFGNLVFYLGVKRYMLVIHPT